jgi:hypothetical protein
LFGVISFAIARPRASPASALFHCSKNRNHRANPKGQEAAHIPCICYGLGGHSLFLRRQRRVETHHLAPFPCALAR